MRTIFIALQCCQCSTMQVKQQKKSSNKWTCVVCNQKQSVRKVYAQGFMAKDVRGFVQSFNMSRGSAEAGCSSPCQTLEIPPSEPEDFAADFSIPQNKRRIDWREYLETEPEIKVEEGDEERGNIIEQMFVTEIPKEMFKKPKLKNPIARTKPAGSEKLLRPVFPKRSSHRRSTEPTDKGSKKQVTLGEKSSQWSNYMKEDIDPADPWRSMNKQRHLGKEIPIHNDPSTEDGSGLLYEGQECFAEDNASELVEDEIHPDFM